MSNQIRQVKEATDIVQIIGEKVQLQKAGRNFRALCPFHSEKSPSFYVAPELQVFRCFGCGEKGDVFSFLQRYEGLTFAEGLKLLAERAGITLEHTHFTPEDDQRERLFQILDFAKQYYHYILTKHRLGEKGKAYLAERHIHTDTVKEFQLGYAPPSWDGLIKYLVGKKKFQILDLEAAGLVILRSSIKEKTKNPRDYYDRFRDRVIFPLTDHRGRVVGFSGRTLSKDVKEAKYINSPETLLYHKSQLLFGYSQSYRPIRDANAVIIVEGEFDVLSSIQAHVRNIVAIKGSALTKEHVQRLQHVVETIVLSLDADAAGQEATKRAIEIAHPFDMRIRVLPNTALSGKDPDDFAREFPKEWRAHVQSSISAYQFLIEAAITKADITTGEGKQKVVKELAPVLNGIPLAVEKAHYIAMLARKLEVAESLIQHDLTAFQKLGKVSTSSTSERGEKKEHLDPLEKVERYIVYLLLMFPEQDIPRMAQQIPVEEIVHSGLKHIVELLQKAKPPFHLQTFARTVPPEIETLLSTIYLDANQETIPTEKELKETWSRHESFTVERQIEGLTLRLEILDQKEEKSAEEEQEQERILQDIVKLRSSLVKYDSTHLTARV